MPPDPSAFLFDLDGTVYVGEQAVPGAAETLAQLRRRGTAFRFITNTTSRSRAMLAERLRGFGIDASPDDIQTPMLAAAAALRERGCRVVAPFSPAGSLPDLGALTLRGGVSGQAATAPDAILVGDLGDRWTYGLMQEAFEYLMTGAAFIALSRDRYFRRGDGLALDAGPFVAGLEYAAGREAVVVGKPSGAFFHAAAASLGVPAAASIAVVGDDLWSDVRGAQQAGLAGWLVRTGKFKSDALAASGIHPDRILDSLADVLPALRRPA